MMEVVLNGEKRAVEDGLDLAALLEEIGAPRQAVAVERNGVVVRRAELVGERIEAGDRIEVVTLVGGG